jgi:GT2 family glycosyltransferase
MQMKVSVLMATYNHEKYITQAIESVLIQQTGFPIELLVGEDCSTDNTRKIIESFANRYPSIVRPVFREKNIGAALNFANLYELSSGEYLAELEGDDYWTDPLKLRKQVAFLEQNQDFSMCFHNAIVYYQDGSKSSHPWVTPGNRNHRRYTLADILPGNFIQSCSVVYRKTLPKIPEWLNSVPMGDWPLHILHAEIGDMGYLDELMSVYRINSESSWMSASKAERIKRSIKATEMIDDALNEKYHYRFTRTITRMYYDLMMEYLICNDRDNALKAAFESINTIKDSAAQASYFPAYMILFTKNIGNLIEKGMIPEAIALFEENKGSFPKVNDLEKLTLVMNSYKAKAGINVEEPMINNKFSNINAEINIMESIKSCENYKDGVTVVIPVFNKFELTKQCLESIRQFPPNVPFDIIIVDNGSSDCTHQEVLDICKTDPNITYIQNETNKGFASACNTGARHSDKKFVMFLNNDTIVRPDWLDALVNVFHDPAVGICGSKLLYPNGTIQHAGFCLKYEIVPVSQFAGESGNSIKANRLLEVIAVTGASLLVRKVVYDSVDGMDERYGMFYEDVDFCLKVHKTGLKIIYNPASSFIHIEAQSITDPKTSIIQSEKSKELFHQKWGDYLLKLMFDSQTLVTEGVVYTPIDIGI